MTTKKILVFLGHTDKESMCGTIADTYESAAKSFGHSVKRVNLGELSFDPILHKGYKVIQELEPDLKKLQDDFRWAEHLVLIYPNWWSTMPAGLKGVFDRFFLPGFAFRMKKNSTYGWEPLLSGRSARVMITMDAPPMISRFLFGDNVNEIRDGILEFAGFRPVEVSKFGPIKGLTGKHKDALLREVASLGKRAV